MKHPAYHLRPNKAVDRLMLVEAIKRLGTLRDLKEYTYYGLGGPYLEDFRLLYGFFDELTMVSLEENIETHKRQQFHLPCNRVELDQRTLSMFLAEYDPGDRKSIFWLDYTRLDYNNFEEFMMLLEKVANDSMIKITLRCHYPDYIDKPGEVTGERARRFREEFGVLMSDREEDPPLKLEDMAKLLQDMLQVAAQRTMQGALTTFLPVSSFCYSDGTGMFTLTGVVCPRGETEEFRQTFRQLQFPNLRWSRPTLIDVPTLSTRERLLLQEHLPCKKYAGRKLRMELGYLIEDDLTATERKLKQYADFHRYSPYFMRAIP